MRKIITLLLAGSCSVMAAQAQRDSLSVWLEKPVLHQVHEAFTKASAVNILDSREVSYKQEGDNTFRYCSYHQIIKVKDDEGIEQYNKVYIYQPYNAEIQDIKARSILPDGKVINLDPSTVKETQKNGKVCKLFAMDGLEKNAEIEFAYVIKRSVIIFNSDTYQDTYLPCQHAFFSLTTPKHLQFSVKGYNGFTVNEDTLIGDNRIVTGYADNVKELSDEKYAFQPQYLSRVDYKLSYNYNGNGNVRLYTWKEFAKKAYPIYTELTSKEEKVLNQFAGKINIPATASTDEKILAVEDYVKSNINIDKDLISEDADDINKIVLTRASNERGANRLMAGIFIKLGIHFQLVFVSSRNSYPMDEELENWDRADDLLLYFPQTGKYLSPSDVTFRYPYVEAAVTGAKGLFLKETQIGSLKTAIGLFKEIEPEPVSASYQNLEADLRINETMDTVLVQSKQSMGGYIAATYRPLFHFLPKDKQLETSKEMLKIQGNNNEVTNIKTENTALTDGFYQKPLIVSGDIKSAELLENAGKKALLKIGEVIGQQSEMYQEKPRQLPMELDYTHWLIRKIVVHIPDNYIVKNPNDLKFAISFSNGTDTTMGFVSDYVLEGNTLTINIREMYNQLRYPLSEFDNFRKVINAAADFNKVMLVLEKKTNS
ncbi:protein of unknown function [Filimonas lacunae]|uniref:DUF3857 domain-containing protein n=1 Tax=Filimonas lacunae TaxID=477680 RepID=A0A173MFJ7_9BACT|nr:DUF3857 domain-containing protein [Filimonas lacunae]BAV06211.1 hypothetical protein FLA_2227 [Filimonas lacunae]SIT25291.1 protein of unknown function [Filimonas lacunae]